MNELTSTSRALLIIGYNLGSLAQRCDFENLHAVERSLESLLEWLEILDMEKSDVAGEIRAYLRMILDNTITQEDLNSIRKKAAGLWYDTIESCI